MEGVVRIDLGKRPAPKLEDALEAQFIASNIRDYKRNARFIPGRRFLADFWFEDLKLCVEVDGGIFMAGRSGHTTGVGVHRDRVRDQLALAHGIQTLRFTTPQIHNGEALAYIQAYLPVRNEEVYLAENSGITRKGFRQKLPPGYGESTTSQRKSRSGKR